PVPASVSLHSFPPRRSSDLIWHFSPFILTSLLRRVWKMLRTLEVDWQLVLLFAPIGLELIRQGLGARWSANHRLFYLSPMGSLGDRKSTRLNSSHGSISYAV